MTISHHSGPTWRPAGLFGTGHLSIVNAAPHVHTLTNSSEGKGWKDWIYVSRYLQRGTFAFQRLQRRWKMLQLIRHVPSCNCRPYWVLTKCVKETIFAQGSTYLENCRQKVSRVEVNFWWAFTPQGPSTGGTNGGVQAHHLFHPQSVRSLFFHLLIDIAWIRWMRKARRGCWLGQIVSLLQQTLQTNCQTGSPSAFSSKLLFSTY